MKSTIPRVLGVTFVTLLTLTPSCSFVPVIFNGTEQRVLVRASEREAKIYVDGQYLGDGHCVAYLERHRSHEVVAKVGDRVGTARISSEISEAGVLDLVGTIFLYFPVFGIVSPGFWTLDTDGLTVVIPPGAATDGMPPHDAVEPAVEVTEEPAPESTADLIM